ncbi:MAG: tyrosine-protein phosphatase [Longimicrobiales bacterium]
MSARRFVDFHNHVLAGVDDGARSEAESRAAVRQLVDAGATGVIATPHFDASLVEQPARFEARLVALDSAWAACADWSAAELPDLQIARGVELKLDVPDPDCSDERLRLAGGRFVLVEFPAMTVPLGSDLLLRAVIEQGFVPVLAHPERYAGFDEALRLARQWKNVGALLQVNAGSLAGRYGERPRHNTMLLLAEGLADYMCSDYHARGLIATTQVLADDVDEGSAWDLLVRTNPERLLQGLDPLPVPALAQPSWWRRMARVIGITERTTDSA